MKKRLKALGLGLGILGVLACCSFAYKSSRDKTTGDGGTAAPAPRIVNIINFIRLLEPRDPKITEDVLFQTVVKQVNQMKKYQLNGTFLLQYDALLDSRYQKLLKQLSPSQFEIGGWLEVPQPLAENAGLKWRGDYPWDSRADVDFTTGYSPAEREKLVDVYMGDFKKIFGYYPKSVGCWYIDAYTLNYLYKKYGIIASCNCKDQIGTDGYTLWGGYWNQAYYPSQKNAYMPAQTETGQIPVPIFRMLGSDPVRQYDIGIGTGRQGVVTLEPVYPFGGADSSWIHWYFKEFVKGEPLAFGYVQAGQENSFTWDAMAKGLEIQFPLIARLRDEKKLLVETLATSGAWFKKKYKVTPSTSVTVNTDLENPDLQTVWFNSRFYRMNLVWDKGQLRFRDIHLFDEKMASPYYDKKSTASQCALFTLPFVDGHLWSSKEKKAGLEFQVMENGKMVPMQGGGKPVINSQKSEQLSICWPLKNNAGTLQMQIDEKKISIYISGKEIQAKDWQLALVTNGQADLPFKNISGQNAACSFEGIQYGVRARKGNFEKGEGETALYIHSEDNHIELNLADRKGS